MRPLTVLGLLVVATLLTAPGARAQQVGTGDEVPLYTNADLAKFGSPAPAPAPASPSEISRQWDFVHDHLDREYERLEVQRRIETERAQLTAAEPEPNPEPIWSGHLLLAPWSPWWFSRTPDRYHALPVGPRLPHKLGGRPRPGQGHLHGARGRRDVVGPRASRGSGPRR
jgi:hypothetical protein